MASPFDAEEFVGNPSAEELKAAKVSKDQLKYIAANFGIQFTHETRKQRLYKERWESPPVYP